MSSSLVSPLYFHRKLKSVPNAVIKLTQYLICLTPLFTFKIWSSYVTTLKKMVELEIMVETEVIVLSDYTSFSNWIGEKLKDQAESRLNRLVNRPSINIRPTRAPSMAHSVFPWVPYLPSRFEPGLKKQHIVFIGNGYSEFFI